MNIEEYLEKFKDIIPFNFQLIIGGPSSNAIIRDKKLISNENREGKKYPIYDEEDFLDPTVEYVPINEIDMQLELAIQCAHSHYLKWENKPESTNKETTEFKVNILNEKSNNKLGLLHLNLTEAGDISKIFCTYYNEDMTHEIIQSIFYKYDEETKKVVPFECLEYIFYNVKEGLEESVSFHKEDDVLKCISISKQRLKNHADDGIVFSDEKVKEKKEFFSRYYDDSPVKNISICDITNYIINKDFTGKLEKLEELNRQLHYLSNRNDNEYVNKRQNYNRITEEITYIKDPKNDIFGNFYGEYIGNTVIKLGSKLILFVETLKDGYHYFTSVDITDTNALNVDILLERKGGASYYQAIKNSDKNPKFKTKIENDEEILIPLGENITEEEKNYFELFKSYCQGSFDAIEKKRQQILSLYEHSNNKRKKKAIGKITNN